MPPLSSFAGQPQSAQPSIGSFAATPQASTAPVPPSESIWSKLMDKVPSLATQQSALTAPTTGGNVSLTDAATSLFGNKNLGGEVGTSINSIGQAIQQKSIKPLLEGGEENHEAFNENPLGQVGDVVNDVALPVSAALGGGAGESALGRIGSAALKYGAAGAVQGTAKAASDNTDLVEGGLEGGALGALGGAAGQSAVEGASALLPNATSQAAKETKNVSTSIQNTMPLTDKATRIEDLENTLPTSGKGTGGVTREGILGKSTPQPTAHDVQVGTTAHEYINGVKDPVQRIANVNQGIRDTSNATDAFLDKNSAPANFEDMRNYVEANNQPEASLKEDPQAYSAYQRTSENALNTLYNTMKTTAKETGDFGAVTPGSDIRTARIAVDQQIKAELKGATLGSPQYTGIKAAAVSARNTLNRMAEDILRYPGQLESLNKYNADLGALQERGIEATPEAKQAIADKYNLKSTPESESNATQLAEQHEKMSNLYDARDNMINKYQSNIGKNKWQEFLKNNPKTSKVIKYGLITGGAGVVGHELL